MEILTDVLEKRGNNFTPDILIWSNRNIFGKNSEKFNNVVYEHTTPLNIFCSKLISCTTTEEIEEMLNNYTGVCIVTKKED